MVNSGAVSDVEGILGLHVASSIPTGKADIRAGAMSAAKAKIEVLDEKAIGADPVKIGLKGSPTKVVTIFPPPTRGGGRKIEWKGDAASLAAMVKEAING